MFLISKKNLQNDFKNVKMQKFGIKKHIPKHNNILKNE